MAGGLTNTTSAYVICRKFYSSEQMYSILCRSCLQWKVVWLALFRWMIFLQVSTARTKLLSCASWAVKNPFPAKHSRITSVFSLLAIYFATPLQIFCLLIFSWGLIFYWKQVLIRSSWTSESSGLSSDYASLAVKTSSFFDIEFSGCWIWLSLSKSRSFPSPGEFLWLVSVGSSNPSDSTTSSPC